MTVRFSGVTGRVGIFLLILGIFSACQSVNVKENYSLDSEQGADKAIIFGTVSQNVETNNSTLADFRINHTTRSKTKIMYSREENPLFDALNSYDFQENLEGGRLFVLEIEPGTHQLDYWSIRDNSVRLYPKVAPPPLEFEAAAGEILYLGNFHMTISTYKNFLGIRMPLGGEPLLRNKYERDLELFHKEYTQFRGQDVLVRVLRDGPWIDDIHDEEELIIPTSE